MAEENAQTLTLELEIGGGGQEQQETPPQATEPEQQQGEAAAAEQSSEPEQESKAEGGEGEGEGETPAESAQPQQEGEGEGAAAATEDKTGEGEGEEKQEEGEPAEAEAKAEPEVEEVVIRPEDSPHWLTSEEVLAKGVPEGEVELYKTFHLREAFHLRAWYEGLKEHTLQTEFVTLSSDEIDVLIAASHPTSPECPQLSEDQQQVLTRLQERIGEAISLYEEDGAFVKIGTRFPLDAVMDRNEAQFISDIRDSVNNAIEVENQSADAYLIWNERAKEGQQREGFIRRGIEGIRRSIRRGRGSGVRRPTEEAKPKLEEATEGDKTEGEGEKKEEGEGEGAPAAEASGGGEGEGEGEGESKTVAVVVTVEDGGTDGPEPAQEPTEPEPEPAAEEPQQTESEPAPAQEQGQEEEAKGEGEASGGEGEADTKREGEEGEGEIQKAEEEPKTKETPKSPKKTHTSRRAKAEPMDNRLLRAFMSSVTDRYRVCSGQEAVELLLRSASVKQDLSQAKAFGLVEGMQVTVSVRRWLPQISRHPGMDFRGFVYNNELHALSQHDDTAYYPSVAEWKGVVQEKVQAFFSEHIKEALSGFGNYIIDFFVAPDKVYITRLHPFYTGVGACLFTWREHGRLFLEGPFQFRIVETAKMSPDCYSSLQPYWQDMLQNLLAQKTVPPRRCVLL